MTFFRCNYMYNCLVILIALYMLTQFVFNSSENGEQTVTVRNLNGANATMLALRSLTYTYDSRHLPEPFFNTSQ